MLNFDEAGERDLRVAKRYALITNTKQGATISESLTHQLYQNFLQKKKKKILAAKIWALVHGKVVLEVCMVAANVMWKVVFKRLLWHLMSDREAGNQFC